MHFPHKGLEQFDYQRGRRENAHLYRWVMNRRFSRAFFERMAVFVAYPVIIYSVVMV